MATCSMPGCGRPHRARGLCSTHYNQAHQPGRHRAHPTQCVVCGASVDRRTDKQRRPTCSPKCRIEVHERDQWVRQGLQLDQHGHAQGTSGRRNPDRAVHQPPSWSSTPPRVCHICGRPTDPDLDCYQPDSPTVDHIIPLSRGGQHTLSNVATAHLHCNAAKQDTAA